jgi:hypothetical protein
MISLGGNNYLSIAEIAQKFNTTEDQIKDILDDKGIAYIRIGDADYILENAFSSIFTSKSNNRGNQEIKSYVIPITEREILAETIKVLEEKNAISISDLREELKARMKLTSEDLKINTNRNDTKFDQKVRNLISHRDFNGLENYCEYKRIGKDSFLIKKGISGQNYLFKDWYR